jgi:hypothetical protein
MEPWHLKLAGCFVGNRTVREQETAGLERKLECCQGLRLIGCSEIGQDVVAANQVQVCYGRVPELGHVGAKRHCLRSSGLIR